MRAKLEVAMIGPPAILLHGLSVNGFRTLKAQALLYYLAATGRPQPRGNLAGLLWGDMPEQQARVNLSKALSELRQILGGLVIIERQQVALGSGADVWSDVARFEAAPAVPRTAAEVAQLAQAVELVRGEFLQGFAVRNAPDFEHWLLGEQERLHRRVIEALDALAVYALNQGKWHDGIAHAQRLVTLDPLHEPGHRHLMALLARSGQRAAALQQYEKARQLLDAELGVEPAPETVQLRDLIQADHLPGQPVATSGDVNLLRDAAPAGRYELPRPVTAFIGRTAERADLRRILADPECRLLTLVGPGGMGKSRLALQVVQEWVETGEAQRDFPDGVYFVPLAPATDINGLAATIAQTILTDLFGSGLSPQQLIEMLREKRLLLVLDNFEHLRDATSLLAGLLAHASGIKLLVTSREALGLTEAWHYPVGGLPVAAGSREGHAASVEDLPDAVRLFVASARRKQPGFELTRHAAEVTRICQLVGGMPLAIELAAAWLNVMPPTAIVAELQRGLDLLTSRNTGLLRHRSIRVVLEESWRLLAAEEAAVFDRLAVFRGGFLPEAGEAVAGATAATLAGLVDRALIQLDETGRFQMHELLHQFAAEKLAQDAEVHTTAHTRHSRYYLDLLSQQYRALNGQYQLATLEAVRADFENIAVAWQWAAEGADFAALGQAVMALWDFCGILGRREDSTALLAQLGNVLAGRDDLAQWRVLYARVLACLGDHLFRLDRSEEALVYVRRSLEYADSERDRAFALVCCAHVEKFAGRHAEAKKFVRESAKLYRKVGSPIELAYVLDKWASNISDHGFRGAQQLSREAVAMSRQAGRLDIIALNLTNLGWLDTACGDYEEAVAHTREGLAIAEQLGHRSVMAWAHDNLAWTYISMGEPDHPDVLPYLRRAIAVTQEIGERSMCAMIMSEYALALSQLGQIEQAVAVIREAAIRARKAGNHVYFGVVFAHFGGILMRTGDYAEARQALREALAVTYADRIDHILLFALYYLGELLLKENSQADPCTRDASMRQAAVLLTVVSHNPATEHYFKAKADRLLATLARECLPTDGDSLTIETVVPRISR